MGNTRDSCEPGNGAEVLERLLYGIRPRLHRFCARMVGSAIDGEDVAQEAMLKAFEAFPRQAQVDNLEAWVFRIARNAAIDFLRSRSRQAQVFVGEEIDAADPVMDTDRGVVAAAGLRQFMRLPTAQRASTILMDVLGYSLEEVAGMLETTVPAVKANLHRGRALLRSIAAEPDAAQPSLPEAERRRLLNYVDRFNARDFDAVRVMLAEDVRLDVNHRRTEGRALVGRYFSNYAAIADWHLAPGLVEGRPVALVYAPDGNLAYFVALTWREDRIATIRDFRYARYIMEAVSPLQL